MRSNLVWPMDPASAEDQLRMEKVRVPVRLLMEGGSHLEGSLWLVPLVEPACERERVVDLLERSEPFLPVTCGDAVRLVNKTRIVMLDVSSATDAGLEDEPTTEVSAEQAVIELCGVPSTASRVDGVLTWSTPPERCRLLDHVNGAGPWMAVERPCGVSLVATRYVRAIILSQPR